LEILDRDPVAAPPVETAFLIIPVGAVELVETGKQVIVQPFGPMKATREAVQENHYGSL
jgi:hypothetical protein